MAKIKHIEVDMIVAESDLNFNATLNPGSETAFMEIWMPEPVPENIRNNGMPLW